MAVINSIRKSTLAGAFIGLGTNLYLIYLPLSLLYVMTAFAGFKDSQINKKLTILTYMFCAMPVSIMALGLDNFATPDLAGNLKSLTTFIYAIIFSWLAISYESTDSRCKIVNFYIIGILAQTFAIILYSANYGVGLSGYGQLINPFTGEDLNSPAIANNLLLAVIFFLFLLAKTRNILLALIYGIIIIFCIIGGLYLGSRLFFICMLMACAYLILTAKLGVYKISLIVALGYCVLIFIDDGSRNYAEAITILTDSLVEKFGSQGVESTRYMHFIDGIMKTIDHPFGGFKTSGSIEATYWFHNVFIDIAKMGGWVTLAASVIAIMYAFFTVFGRGVRFTDSDSLRAIFLMCFLVINQDVVFEGNQRPLILLFIIAATLTCTIDRSMKSSK